MKKKVVLIICLSILIVLGISLNLLAKEDEAVVSKICAKVKTCDIAQNATVVTTFDYSATDADNVTGTLYSDGGLIFSGTGNMKEIETKPYDISLVTYVEIREGITNVPDYAFKNHTNLTSITMPSTIESIGMCAFWKTKISTIEIPSGVTYLDYYGIGGMAVFSGADNLTTVTVNPNNQRYTAVDNVIFNKDMTTLLYYLHTKTNETYDIPSSVTNMAEGAINGNNNLKRITIPNALENLEKIFDFCDSCYELESIVVASSNPNFKTENGILYNKDLTTMEYYPRGKKDETYIVPNTVKNLERIANKYLKKVYIPNSIEEINRIEDNIEIEVDNNKFCIVDNVLYNKELTKLITGPIYGTETIRIPDTVIVNSNSFNKFIFVYRRNLVRWETKKLILSENTVESSDITSLYPETFKNKEGITIICNESSSQKIEELVHFYDEQINNELTDFLLNELYYYKNMGYTGYDWNIELSDNKEEWIGYIINDKGEENEKIRRPRILLDPVVDKTLPTINSVTGVPENWTSESITLTINASDETGLAYNAYSFDGGATWQAENTKTFNTSIENLSIKVKDAVGNIVAYDPINSEKQIVVTSTKYSINDTFIKKIAARTLLSAFKTLISANTHNIKLYDGSNEIGDTGIIKTGTRAVFEGKKTYTLIVNGDTDKNGEINIQDIMSMNKHRLNKVTLDEVSSLAGDIDENGRIDMMDILQVNKYRLGKISSL